MTLEPSILRMLIDYKPSNGTLVWKERPRTRFRSNAEWKRFNGRYAGTAALACPNGWGYLHGRIFYHMYMAHRVAWTIHHGRWPEMEIDHINGIRNDNRIANLREVSKSGNQKNRKLGVNNRSGRVGVWFDPSRNKWKATIGHNGLWIHLGMFKDFDSACDARNSAELDLGFHEMHGRR